MARDPDKRYPSAAAFRAALDAAVGLGDAEPVPRHMRKRHPLLPRLTVLAAAAATVLTVIAFLKIRLHDDYGYDVGTKPRVYLALAGVACFLLCTAFVAILESRREELPVGAPAAR
jgi:hypothetical protein